VTRGVIAHFSDSLTGQDGHLREQPGGGAASARGPPAGCRVQASLAEDEVVLGPVDTAGEFLGLESGHLRILDLSLMLGVEGFQTCKVCNEGQVR